ncbi:MAG: carboxypeptidase-like regulatory domain-containing protein, partial [Longimicrobiales bacterium]
MVWNVRSRLPGSAIRATFLLSLVTLLGPAQLQAQQGGRVSGIVVESTTRLPVIGAQVMIDGSRQGVLTDQRGRFNIGSLTGTDVTLRVISIGYRDVT